jgi:hypothetical protein
MMVHSFRVLLARIAMLRAFLRRQAVRCLPAIFSGFVDPLISA